MAGGRPGSSIGFQIPKRNTVGASKSTIPYTTIILDQKLGTLVSTEEVGFIIKCDLTTDKVTTPRELPV